jgi:hypothetical protein
MFVQTLVILGFPIRVAAWLRMEGTWQLYIASPDVETHGPIAVYKFLHGVYKKMSVMKADGTLTLEQEDIVAANTTNHFVNAVVSFVHHPLQGGTVARLTNCTLNGVLVEDMVLYISNKNVKPSPRREKKATAAEVNKALAIGPREFA